MGYAELTSSCYPIYMFIAYQAALSDMKNQSKK